ncbi:MAG: MFS transporter [Lentisphaeria bacterium]|nr:MFS transporter [Lentisphaeria bacterium]
MSNQPQEYIDTPETLEKFKREFRFHRFRFGIANLFFQCEESSLGAVKAAVLKALGANDRHFGILGACSGFIRLFEFLAMPLLNHYRSYYRSMRSALWVGVLSASVLAGAVLLGNIPNWGIIGIWSFLIWSIVMSIATGVQINVELAWIGDMVPRKLLGWFTSVKYIISVVGMALLSLVFSLVYDYFDKIDPDNAPSVIRCLSWLENLFPHSERNFWALLACSLLFLFVAASHVAAIVLISQVPDQTPVEAKFISKKRSERINYRALPLWTYTIFFIFWTGGRTAHYALTSIFLMRIYDMKITGVAILAAIGTLTQAVSLFVMGKVSDRWGNRKLLMIVSGVVACSMYIWTLTAWTGWKIIIASYLIEGLAGHNHSMLSNNYGIEIFPGKGRAAYFGVVHLALGIVCVLLTCFVGEFSHALEKLQWSMEFLGATLTHYHLVFFCCSTFTLCCVIPLLLVGNRVVKPPEQDKSSDD